MRRAAYYAFCAIMLAAPSTAFAQAAPDATRFTIERFSVQGSTLIPPPEVERMLAPFAGHERDFGDVQRALETLKDAYNQRGYGVVQVVLPEQDISSGVVVLRVVEARVGKVHIEGNKHFSEQNVRASLPSVQEGGIPRSVDIARNLQLLADNPAKQTSVIFKSGATGEQVDAEVKIADERPWRYFATLDNTGTDETGQTRVGIGFRHSNLFDRDHEINIRYITSVERPSDVSVYGVGYYIPVYRWGGAFNFTAGYSDVNSGTLPSLFNVSGSGTVFGARYIQHLTPTSPYEHKLSVSADYRAYQNDVIFEGQGFVPDITVHPVTIGYSGTWRRATTLLGFNVALVRNISGGSNGGAADFQAARPTARAAYRIIRYSANAAQSFAGDWIAAANVQGQETNDALVPGEQFGLGGPDNVRALDPREIASDRGYQATVELLTPDLARALGKGEHVARLAAFFDWGTLWRNNALPGEQSEESVASAGIGLRYQWRKDVSVRLDLAHLLAGTSTRESGRTKLHAALAVAF